MIVKTKSKITFYPDRFNPKKEFFYGEIRSVEITDFKNILVSGSYFYKEANENVSLGQFNFNVKRNEAEAYFSKFTSAKTDFMSVLEETLYYVLLEEMAKDLASIAGIAKGDLEITDFQKNLK